MNPRSKMNELLNGMFHLFARVASISKHEKEIEDYIELQDEAKDLLARLCSKGLEECISCDGCN